MTTSYPVQFSRSSRKYRVVKKSGKKYPKMGAKPLMSSKNLRTGGYLGIEYKFVDQLLADTLVVSATDYSGGEIDPATNNCLNAVAQGTGENQRDGRKYTVTGVHIRGAVLRQNRNNQTEVGDANFVMIALVQDTQTNGSQCQSEEVFSGPTGGDAVFAFANLENSKRFRILHREIIAVPAGAPSWNGTADQLETGGTICPFEINKSLKMVVNCSSTGATVSDITDNSLHLIAFALNTGSNSNGIEVTYSSRVRFVG